MDCLLLHKSTTSRLERTEKKLLKQKSRVRISTKINREEKTLIYLCAPQAFLEDFLYILKGSKHLIVTFSVLCAAMTIPEVNQLLAEKRSETSSLACSTCFFLVSIF